MAHHRPRLAYQVLAAVRRQAFRTREVPAKEIQALLIGEMSDHCGEAGEWVLFAVPQCGAGKAYAVGSSSLICSKLIFEVDLLYF